MNVSFQHTMKWWGNCTDPLQVLCSTTGTAPEDFTVRLDHTCGLPNPLCSTCQLPIEHLSGDHVYVAWRYQGTFAATWYVANIVIEGLTGPIEETSWGSIKAMHR